MKKTVLLCEKADTILKAFLNWTRRPSNRFAENIEGISGSGDGGSKAKVMNYSPLNLSSISFVLFPVSEPSMNLNTEFETQLACRLLPGRHWIMPIFITFTDSSFAHTLH